MKPFEIVNDGLTLRGTIFYPKESKDKNPAILFIPGWTSEKKRSYQYADALVKLGYICVLIDLRGHGESDGNLEEYTNKQFLEDVVAAYDYTAQIFEVDKHNVSAVGSSFGGYLVSLLSSKRNVKNLVLRAPADYADQEFEELKKLHSSKDPSVMKWRKTYKNHSETATLRAIHKFQGKILIIESEFDKAIPAETIKSYEDAVQDKRRLTHKVIKGAPHSIKEKPFKDSVEKILTKFFGEIVR